MIWILPIMIAFGWAFWNKWTSNSILGRSFGNSFMEGFFSAFFVGIICLAVSLILSAAMQTKRVQISDDALVAIRDKDGLQGHFFLGTGMLEGRPHYFYYRQLSDGGYQPGSVVADEDVFIYEEEGETARLVTFQTEFKHDWQYWFSLPLNLSNHYEFHVPKGTIRRGFSM